MRRPRSEAGASLILALAMVTMISVALVGALGYSTTSLRTVAVIGSQRSSAYAADGGVQTAIQALRNDVAAGTTAVGTACPTVNYAAVGVQPAVAVTCQVVAARSAGVPGVSVPNYAVQSLGSSTVEQGFYASPGLKITGAVASNSPAVGVNSTDSVQVVGTLDLTGTTLNARGSCSGTITIAAADKHCNTGVSIADPAYPAQTPDLTTPNQAPTCSVANAVLQFSPGYYTDTTEFETPDYSPGAGPTCKTGYLYFKPGVYYFDFGFDPAYVGTSWDVTAGQFIVGGEAKGWNPATAGSFPATPGGGSAVACKTDSDGATSGVQFIFGGASQFNVATAAAKVELCPNPAPTGTSQQIAIYGQKTGAAAPATANPVPTASVQNPLNSWTTVANLLPVGAGTATIDTKYAVNPIAASATESVTLNGYLNSDSLVPAGSINVSYALKIAHSETLASAATNVSSLIAAIGANCTALAATKHTTTTATVALVTDTIPLTTPACIAAVKSNFSVSYTMAAASTKTFTENLDGIDLVVTYTRPALEAQSGCILVPLASGGCTFLGLGSNGNKIAIWGTVYAPLTTVLDDDSNSSTVELRRGIVARGVGLLNAPTTGDTSGSFCLGGGSPCGGSSRVLMLTATVSGGVRIRALVQYTDTPAIGTAAQILAWNVLRG